MGRPLIRRRFLSASGRIRTYSLGRHDLLTGIPRDDRRLGTQNKLKDGFTESNPHATREERRYEDDPNYCCERLVGNCAYGRRRMVLRPDRHSGLSVSTGTAVPATLLGRQRLHELCSVLPQAGRISSQALREIQRACDTTSIRRLQRRGRDTASGKL
jgi:hypothetical protein